MRIPPGVRRAFRLPSSTDRIVRDVDDEVRFHVEKRAEALMARGYSREQAYADALRRFGDVDDLRDYCVSIEVTHMQRMQKREWLSTVAQDFRFALRQCAKSPGFALVSALTLALGVGATTAIFSVVNGVVLRPLPFPASEQIVQFAGIDAKGQKLRATADPTFDAIAAESRSFTALAEYQQQAMTVIVGDEPVRIGGALVSRGFFDVMGVKPLVGRFFLPDEQQPGAPIAAVISHGLWERQFGASRDVIGRRVMSGRTPMTIVGVLPRDQQYPSRADILIPRELRQKNTSYTAHNWFVLGRLRPGVTLAQANGELSRILRGVHERVGDDTWTVDGGVVTLREQIVGNVRSLLLLLFAASGVLLLIACANVANLLIARMASRQGEIAVRLAIGAARMRLAQQFLIEAAVLAAIGCAGGLLLAYAGIKTLLALRPVSIPRVAELSLDWRVTTFAIVMAAGTAMTLGLLAAWRGTGGDLREALSQSQRTQGGGGASYRLRGSLVVAQLAMTVVLLVGAGLLTRSFVRLMTIDAGFRTKDVVLANMAFDIDDAKERIGRRVQQVDELIARARAIPGVSAVGVSDAEPFSGGSSNGTFLILPSADMKITMEALGPMMRDKSLTGYATYRIASPDYFKALGIPLLSGRMFNDLDRPDGPHVGVISATLAKKQWPNESPIGKVIEFGNIDGDLTPITIVGVVGDTRERDLTADPQGDVYLSYRQRPGNGAGMTIVMATTTESSTIASARQIFRQVRGDVPMRFSTVEEIIARSLATQRFMLLLVAVFASVALLLATLGVYSVISYLVAQRGKEISIRVALGARGGDIVRLVVRQGVTLAVIGAVLGAAAAFGTTRLLAKLLFEISATDPIAFGGVIVLLCAVALLASYLPARRAARLSPMDVLRAG